MTLKKINTFGILEHYEINQKLNQRDYTSLQKYLATFSTLEQWLTFYENEAQRILKQHPRSPSEN